MYNFKASGLSGAIHFEPVKADLYAEPAVCVTTGLSDDSDELVIHCPIYMTAGDLREAALHFDALAEKLRAK